MDAHQLVYEVQSRLGGITEGEARAAIYATLRALSEHMQPVDRGVVAGALPPPFAAVLDEAAERGPHDLTSFCARVAALAKVSPGFAASRATAVCRALMVHLDEQRRAHLALALWPQLLRPGQLGRDSLPAPEKRALLRPPRNRRDFRADIRADRRRTNQP